MSGISDNTGDVNKKKTSTSNPASRQWELSRLTILCYAPAFLLVILSFWYMLISNLFPNQELFTVLINRQIEQKVPEILEREIEPTSDNQQQDTEKGLTQEQIITDDADSILVKGYIDGQVREEVQIQAEKAAKAEINQAKTELETLRNSWTADLFNQIAFAVIFTVASIFAAFAVKDVLTEILKDQEKTRIKQELKNELELYVTDDLLKDKVRSQTRTLDRNIKNIEAYTYWLEHELLADKIFQLLDNTCSSSVPGVQQNNSNSEAERLSSSQESVLNEKIEDNIVLSLEKMMDRSYRSLQKASGKFISSDIDLFKAAERECLKQNIKCAQLKEISKIALLQKLDDLEKDKAFNTEVSWLHKETVDERFINIFEVQVMLLIETLSKLPGDNSELIERLKQALKSNPREEEEKQRRESISRIEKLNENPFGDS